MFQDSNGDGIGDFPGLTDRLDHIASLGVTCLWLMPFYPTPDLDDGYDVTDHYGVDPRYGSLGDLVDFLGAAREHGLRVGTTTRRRASGSCIASTGTSPI